MICWPSILLKKYFVCLCWSGRNWFAQ